MPQDELLVVEECPFKNGPKFLDEPVVFPDYRLAKSSVRVACIWRRLRLSVGAAIAIDAGVRQGSEPCLPAVSYSWRISENPPSSLRVTE
jgi:hypothetical protein